MTSTRGLWTRFTVSSIHSFQRSGSQNQPKSRCLPPEPMSQLHQWMQLGWQTSAVAPRMHCQVVLEQFFSSGGLHTTFGHWKLANGGGEVGWGLWFQLDFFVLQTKCAVSSAKVSYYLGLVGNKSLCCFVSLWGLPNLELRFSFNNPCALGY